MRTGTFERNRTALPPYHKSAPGEEGPVLEAAHITAVFTAHLRVLYARLLQPILNDALCNSVLAVPLGGEEDMEEQEAEGTTLVTCGARFCDMRSRHMGIPPNRLPESTREGDLVTAASARSRTWQTGP